MFDLAGKYSTGAGKNHQMSNDGGKMEISDRPRQAERLPIL